MQLSNETENWQPVHTQSSLYRGYRTPPSAPLWGARSIVSGSIFAWRWSFQMQAVNMRDQFSFRGPATEVEAQHLIRPLGRGSSDPQADQQACDKGRIHLD